MSKCFFNLMFIPIFTYNQLNIYYMKKLICMMILLIGFSFASTAATVEATIFDLTAVSIDYGSFVVLPIATIAASNPDIESLSGWIPLSNWNEGLDTRDKLPVKRIAEVLDLKLNDVIVLSDEDYGCNELANTYEDLDSIRNGSIDCNDGGYIDYRLFEDTEGVKTAVGWYQDGNGGQSGFSFIFTNKNQEFRIE